MLFLTQDPTVYDFTEADEALTFSDEEDDQQHTPSKVN